MKNILLLGKMCLCENKMTELYGWASDTYSDCQMKLRRWDESDKIRRQSINAEGALNAHVCKEKR